MTDQEVKLIKYDRACKAIAAAKRVDEVKRIRDVAVAMKAYARQANNHELEADAIEIRMRATRRMDQMRQEQAKTIGLAKGGGGKHGRKRVAEKPTLKDAGINKNLAHEGRKLGALSDQEFEQKVTQARADAISLAEFAERTEKRQKPPEGEAKKHRALTSDDLHRAAAERFPEWLADVARGLGGFEPAAETAAVLPAKHMRVDEDAERIMRFLDEFRRARRDQRRELKPELKVVGGEGDNGGATKH
jgi:hypothetical protein